MKLIVLFFVLMTSCAFAAEAVKPVASPVPVAHVKKHKKMHKAEKKEAIKPMASPSPKK